jgi:hypothetical protein
MPDWRQHKNNTDVTKTRFKLADGGKSAAPEGQISLNLTIGGQLVKGEFWVLKNLTTNMIVGSQLLSWMGATIDYNKHEITSRTYPDMKRIPFDLNRSRKWRKLTSVVATSDIILRPNTVTMTIGEIPAREMYTLTHGETDFGGVVPTIGMGGRGIEVKHTLQSVRVHKDNRKSVGRLNVILQNCSRKTVRIQKGDEIGGYKPQCEEAEDRYNLATAQGTGLAAALNLQGAGLLKELDMDLVEARKKETTDVLSVATPRSETDREGHTSEVTESERAKEL